MADGEVVTHELTLSEQMWLTPGIPIEVQIRLKLNKKGFQFVDDGKFSSIMNRNPEPLGKLTMWKDVMTGSIHYKQILKDNTRTKRTPVVSRG